MMRRFEELKRFTVKALHDETIGGLKDLFLDSDWLIRYLVVDADAAGWINRQVVLLSPTALRAVPEDSYDISTTLDIERVRAAPALRDDETPTRAIEQRLADHYGWWRYWSASGAGSAGLVSLASLLRRKVDAADGHAGSLKDVLIDLEAWRVSQLIVDAGSWLHSRPVLIDAGVVKDLRPETDHLRLSLARDQIKAAPPFDPFAPGLRDDRRDDHPGVHFEP